MKSERLLMVCRALRASWLTGVGAVLIPQMHKVGCGVGRKLMFTQMVGWTLRDSANRNVLWMATNAIGKVAHPLFDHPSTKEYRAFTTAPKIQRMSRK